MFSLNKNCRGFTLTEVLIAIVILATGLMLVIEGMARSQNAMRIAENLVRASLLADQKYTETEMEVIDRHEAHIGTEQGVLRLPGKEFTWEKKISGFAGHGIKDQTIAGQVDVSVVWKEGGKRNNRMLLESILLNQSKKE